MADFATVNDVITIFRPLSTEETAKATNLLPVVSDRLRFEAHKVGKDLDLMMVEDPALVNVAKCVVVDIVARCLMTPTSGAPMSQMSESALGYSVSGTFLNPGGGLFIKKTELAALGLRKQKIGVISLWP